MKNAIIYQKEECVLIKNITISSKRFAFFVSVNSKKIIYLKENYVNGEVNYASFEKLMQFFPQYQTASSFNTRLILDTFVNTFNYKISIGEITNSDEILEFINQFELFLGDPYISMMTNDNNARYFNKQAMFEVTNAIKKLSITVKKVDLNELLRVESTNTTDIFLSTNWLDEKNNKDIVYQSILDNDKKRRRRSPIDFLFNNRVLNIYMVIMVIAVVVFATSFELLMQVKESEKVTEEEIDEIIEEALIEDPVEQTQDDIENSNVQDPTSNIPSNSNSSQNSNSSSNSNNSNSNKPVKYGEEYSKYKGMSLLNVDFNKLKKTNSDTVAYLYVHNTDVSYPVVQTDNNTYYLNHSFTKRSSAAGWIYADKSCDMVNLDRNTVIYGHGLTTSDSMFSSLHDTLKSSWYKNKNNQVIKMSTPTHDMLWQIVSIYTIKEENYYLKVKHKNDEEYAKWIKTIVGRSKYNFGVKTSIKNKFLTLSTCKDYKNNRIVIHAVLVERKKK